jgi:hypothetical protein
VLPAAEPFLLRRGHHAPVDGERRRRVVKDGIDAEYSH